MLVRDKCLRSEGPFPFVAGPLMVFSHQLAAELVRLPELVNGELRVSEAYARRQGALKHILLEDVYYGFLIFKHFGKVRLLYVRLAMVEWATGFWYKMAPAHCSHGTCTSNVSESSRLTPTYDIFHRLKLPKYFDVFRRHDASSKALLAPRNYTGGPRCGAMGDLMNRSSGCCTKWQACFPGVLCRSARCEHQSLDELTSLRAS